MARATANFQAILADSGALPVSEGLMLARLLRLCLPGLGDSQYAACDAELHGFLNDRHRQGGGAPSSKPSNLAD